MQRFVVTGPVAHLGPGMVLALSKDQIRRRAHRLRAVKGGHEPIEMLDFKNGEEFGIVRGAENLRKADLADITPAPDAEAEKQKGADGEKGKAGDGEKAK